MRLYVDDFRRYPPFSADQFGAAINRSLYWDSLVLVYVSGNQGAFVCPAGTNDNAGTNWILNSGGSVWPNQSYGYNVHGISPREWNAQPIGSTILGLGGLLGWNGNRYQLDFVLESDVLAPSDMISVADYDPFIDDDGDGDLHPDLLYTVTLTGKRHAQSANVVFCDAHVEYARTNLLTDRNGPNRPRWNNDHQPHFELP